MAITKLEKSKALRPSAIDTLDKVNEVVEFVNNLDSAALKGDIEQIKKEQLTQNSNISALQAADKDINASIDSINTDIDAVKVTLYTPLSEGDN